MAHLIDKDALVAEMNKLLDKGKCHNEYERAFRDGNNGALYALKSKLKTIEVKEVDLEKESLTWEDIPTILTISEQLKTGWWFVDRTKDIGTQAFWEEVLKRFKAQKGESV